MAGSKPTLKTFDEQLAEANQATIVAPPIAVAADAAIKNGCCVLWTITSIEPIKRELDAVGPTLDDPRLEVPWLAGCIVKMVAVRSRQLNGTDVKELIVCNDPNSDDPTVELPYTTKGMKRHKIIMADSLARGYVRFTMRDGSGFKKVTPGLPSDWDTMSPFARLTYFLKIFAMMLGVPEGQVQVGTTFYAFVRTFKDKADKWQTEIDTTHKTDDDVIQYAPHLINPSLVGSYPVRVAKKVVDIMEIEKVEKQAQATAFGNPNNVTGESNSTTAPWDEAKEAGF
jgi:hypothetical protein